jgi:hypothetical protein
VFTWLFIKWPVHAKAETNVKEEQEEEKLFITPLPTPVTDDPSSASPKLYRPFRHGPNFITMGIRNLGWNN